MTANLIRFFSAIKKRIQQLATTSFMKGIVIIPPLSIVCMLVIILSQISHLPPEIPLFYSRPWGEEQLTQPLWLFILPVSCAFWYIFSILLIHFQAYQYRVFSQLLLITQAVLALGLMYILIRIILLVT